MEIALNPKDFFKYCPKCGQVYSKESALGQHHQKCQNCGFLFFQNPRSTVNALVLNQNQEILLTKRARDPAKGCWDLPGGFIDWGEDPVEALKREMKEELRVEFEATKIFLACHSWYPFMGLNVSLTVLVYTGTLKGEIIPDDDVAGYQWFNLDQLPQNISFPGMKMIIEKLKKEL